MPLTLNEYRKAVTAAVPCPGCGARVDERCIKVWKSKDKPGEWQELGYIHDDRSMEYHNLAIATTSERSF